MRDDYFRRLRHEQAEEREAEERDQRLHDRLLHELLDAVLNVLPDIYGRHKYGRSTYETDRRYRHLDLSEADKVEVWDPEPLDNFELWRESMRIDFALAFYPRSGSYSSRDAIDWLLERRAKIAQERKNREKNNNGNRSRAAKTSRNR